MLEVLPPGASKGHGVEVLLKHLGIDPLHLMALGERTTAISSEWEIPTKTAQNCKKSRGFTTLGERSPIKVNSNQRTSAHSCKEKKKKAIFFGEAS